MADDQELGTLIEERVNAAIEATVGELEHGIVTKWVAIVETVNPDGERGLWTMTSNGVKAWDTVGLLQHGMHLQMRQTLNPDSDL
jgi:hypothetical protein